MTQFGRSHYVEVVYVYFVTYLAVIRACLNNDDCLSFTQIFGNRTYTFPIQQCCVYLKTPVCINNNDFNRLCNPVSTTPDPWTSLPKTDNWTHNSPDQPYIINNNNRSRSSAITMEIGPLVVMIVAFVVLLVICSIVMQCISKYRQRRRTRRFTDQLETAMSVPTRQREQTRGNPISQVNQVAIADEIPEPSPPPYPYGQNSYPHGEDPPSYEDAISNETVRTSTANIPLEDPPRYDEVV